MIYNFLALINNSLNRKFFNFLGLKLLLNFSMEKIAVHEKLTISFHNDEQLKENEDQ